MAKRTAKKAAAKGAGKKMMTEYVPEMPIMPPNAQEVLKLHTAADEVNKFIEEGSKANVKMGHYLLKTFFDNNAEKARSRNPAKDSSLRKLSELVDASPATLSRAVLAATVQKSLSQSAVSTVKQLSASHLVALAVVDDEAMLAEYAKKVVDEQLSSRKLKEVLLDDGYIRQRGMAAVTDGQDKKLSEGRMLAVHRAFETIQEKVDRIDFQKLDKRTARNALKEVEAAQKHLKAIVKKLNERLQ